MRKRHILTTLCLSAALGVFAQVRWLNPVYDFGAFSEELGAVDAVFEMVNDSDQPIRILDARATCGCTQPEIPKGTIAPGDTARITVTYLASGRPGKFSKPIYIKTSDNPKEQRTLRVEGTVIGSSGTLASRYPVVAGPMRLRSKTVGFGEITRGKQKTIFVEAYNQSADTLRPSITGLPEYVDLSISPEQVGPGEQQQLVFTLQTTRVPQWGIISEEFGFIPVEGGDTVKMDFFTIISEDFSRMTPGERMKAPIASVEPSRIDLGEISSDATPHTVEFTIRNNGKSPLLIRRVQTADPSVTAVNLSSEKIKGGKSAKITVTVDASKSTTEFVNARVTVITNDPDNSLITTRVTAEIKD